MFAYCNNTPVSALDIFGSMAGRANSTVAICDGGSARYSVDLPVKTECHELFKYLYDSHYIPWRGDGHCSVSVEVSYSGRVDFINEDKLEVLVEGASTVAGVAEFTFGRVGKNGQVASNIGVIESRISTAGDILLFAGIALLLIPDKRTPGDGNYDMYTVSTEVVSVVPSSMGNGYSVITTTTNSTYLWCENAIGGAFWYLLDSSGSQEERVVHIP